MVSLSYDKSKIVVRYFVNRGLDLQNILRKSYDCRTIMLKLQSIYDGRLIYTTSDEERKAFLR